MIEINDKEYEINLDLKMGTESLMAKIYNDPENPKNMKYLRMVLKDLLIPTPTDSELFNFRRSDRDRVFELFAKEMEEISTDFKKKRSR